MLRVGEHTELILEEAHLHARVTDRSDIADGVASLTLAADDGRALPPWQPGAHVDLILPNGLVRQYSLCGDPEDRTSYRVGVLLEPAGRGGSRWIHENLHVGDSVEVRGPRNHFRLDEAERYVFIAGGIGITPILAMIREVEQRGQEWQLFYGGRRRSTMAFAGDLATRGRRVQLWPQDEVDLIDLAVALADPSPGTSVYACGPEPLLRAVEERCSAGWPTGSLHVERFVAKDVDTSEDRSFEIELADGRVLDVPAGQSALEVLEDAGFDILSSCREGTCGTCEVEIVAGKAEHRDTVLTPEEQAEHTCMMVCVSRAACPRLVLDL